MNYGIAVTGDLMKRACARLEQEISRLGGTYAHVLDESVDSRRDEVTGERLAGHTRTCSTVTPAARFLQFGMLLKQMS